MKIDLLSLLGNLILRKMGRSTEYYKTHPEAREKKAKKDKEINERPEQKAKRRELGRKNYATDKAKGRDYRKGKDCSHTSSGLKYKSVKSNRGSKSDTKGDRNARG